MRNGKRQELKYPVCIQLMMICSMRKLSIAFAQGILYLKQTIFLVSEFSRIRDSDPGFSDSAEFDCRVVKKVIK